MNLMMLQVIDKNYFGLFCSLNNQLILSLKKMFRLLLNAPVFLEIIHTLVRSYIISPLKKMTIALLPKTPYK